MSGGARSVAIPGMTKEKMQEQALPLSAAYVIWHRRFDCRIPQMYLHNLEAESIIGAPTSGDPQLDRQMARQMMPAAMTIAAMALLRREGASILIDSQDDAVTIYNTIYKHQQDWKRELAVSLHRRNAPVDDLRMLDDLAGEIYPFARRRIAELHAFHGQLGDGFETFFSHLGSFRQRNKEIEQEQKIDVIQPVQHTRTSDDVAEMMAKRRQRFAQWPA